MLAAAKEKITPVFPLAARLPVNQFGFVSSNSRQGFPPEIPPCIGPSTFVSSTSHWGCAPFSCDSTVARLVGLDYFGARYYSGAQGRFSGADEPFADQDASDPQSWNLYAYVRNGPLIGVDPTGSVALNPWRWGGPFSQFAYDVLKQAASVAQQTQDTLSLLATAADILRHSQLCPGAVTAAGTAVGAGVGWAVGGATGAAAGGAGGTLVEPGGGTFASGVVGFGVGSTAVAAAGGALGGVGGALWSKALCSSSTGNSSSSGGNSGGGGNSADAQKIADGHAFGKHAKEFGSPSKAQFKQLVEETMDSGQAKSLSNGRTGYWNATDQMVVITDPSSPDGGTAFRPVDGVNYFNNLR